MRSVSSATWTSGDPESDLPRPNSPVSCCFRSLVNGITISAFLFWCAHRARHRLPTTVDFLGNDQLLQMDELTQPRAAGLRLLDDQLQHNSTHNCRLLKLISLMM